MSKPFPKLFNPFPEISGNLFEQLQARQGRRMAPLLLGSPLPPPSPDPMAEAYRSAMQALDEHLRKSIMVRRVEPESNFTGDEAVAASEKTRDEIEKLFWGK